MAVGRRFLFCLLAIGILRGQDAAEIVRKSLDRDMRNFERLKNYTYQSREEDRELDKDSKVKKTTIETYDIMMVGSRPYERLVMRDDKPLSAKDERKEQEKLDKETAKRERDTPADRAKRDKERAEERRYFAEIPKAFTLRIAGVENISGKPAWVIEAEPRHDYKPSNVPHANLLTKVRGKFWIDQAEYQWVKADIEAVEAISFGLGLFRIAPGGRISFEQIRINDEVWLPSKVAIHGEARVAYLKKMREEFNITYRDYKKFQADSKLVAGEEK
jgi:hypothetical protein